jgi:hypothetical protein
MPKKRKPRKPAKPLSGPPKAIKDFAAQYKCSHCNSQVDGLTRDPSGIYRLAVSHDDSCPVLRGVLPDVPDAVRAALTAGRGAMVITGLFGEGAE